MARRQPASADRAPRPAPGRCLLIDAGLVLLDTLTALGHVPQDVEVLESSHKRSRKLAIW
jgi:hypothetical protein